MKRIIVLLLVSSIVAVIVGLFTLSSYLTRWGVEYAFAEQNLTLKESLSVSYDPFISELNVKNFALLHNNTTELVSFDSMRINLELAPLFNQGLIINDIELSGLALNMAKQDDNALLLNGWSTDNFTTSTGESADKNSETKSQAEQAKPSEPFITDVLISNIELSNILINTNLNNQRHNIDLKNLTIENFDLQLNNKLQPKALNFKLNSDLAYKLSDDNQGLSVITNILLGLSPQITFDDPDTVAVYLEQAGLTLNDTKVVSSPQDVSVNFEQWHTDIAEINVTAGENLRADVMYKTSLKNTNVSTVKTAQTMLTLASFQLNNVSSIVDLNDAVPKYNVAFSDANFVNLQLMPNEDQTVPKLLDLTELTIKNVELSNSLASIENIIIGDLSTNVIVNKDKSLANLVLPSPAQPSDSMTDKVTANSKNNTTTDTVSSQQASIETATESTNESTTESTKASGPTITLKLAELSNNGIFNLNTLDLSVEPNFRSLIQVQSIRLADIDSSQPQLVSVFDLAATNNTYAQINVSDRSQLFIESPKHDIKITLDEIDLASISPYISSALGYHINTGQLDSTINANIVGNKIEGEADLLMRSVDLTAISNQGEESSFSGGAISFNYALGMLKDGDGHVELNVPFDGDLNNPSVGFSGFLSLIVQRATMSAAKDYLINTFVPYANVVNFALSASKHVLKLRFNDMLFEPQQDALTDKEIQRLQELALVLQKHDSTNIRLCPISVIDDLLSKEAEENEQSSVSKKSITAEQVQQLIDLGQRRAEDTKSFLVNKGEIKSKRILACAPTIEYKANAKPRIAFNET
ncbi:DUF748 domain-containing protein [Psychrosphaera aestuarii]|uniref:DUF748 domain-containing protein n=1 Tax=Psychrosphaera aestuarii TaxID=1266052 RepID=UPI001B31ED96|nr:DUF748 domain-containing protein [Psychrosphaera aestuarii]